MGGTLSVAEDAYSRFAKDIKKQNIDHSECMTTFVDQCSDMIVTSVLITYQ